MPTLASIQIGQPTDYQPVENDTSDKPWRTAFFKQPVDGPIEAMELGLMGDGVADPRNHGGVDKAICCYSAEWFPYWRERLGLGDEFGGGAFGENFTVAGWSEADICVGDRWRIGDAMFEVSQPRQPCWKLARRWRVKELTLWVQQTGYTGWYVRVVEPGVVTPGDTIELVDRSQPDWTIARANGVMYDRADDREANAALVAIEPLSDSWKQQLGKRLSSFPQHGRSSSSGRAKG